MTLWLLLYLSSCISICSFFFFFQAEDGIRDYKVTGVQTCALPISFVGGQILYVLGRSSSPFSYPANPALAVGIDPATGAPPNRTVEIYGALSEIGRASCRERV